MFTQENFFKFLERFDEEMRGNMTETYILSFQEHLQECEEAKKEQNAQRLRYSAHDLKSISYTIEAQDLGALAEEIETNIIKKNEICAFDKVSGLRPLINQVIEIIKG